MKFIHSLQSEWLKTRNSAASWLCITGGFFLPLMFLTGFLMNHDSINKLGKAGTQWLGYNAKLWQFMGIFFLPLGIVLAAGLVLQLEYKNNSWKQLHTTPQSYAVIFSAKFTTLLLMTVQFFLFFNAGMLLAAIIPALLFDGYLPAEPFPWAWLFRLNGRFFMACLPILAFQYLLSLLFRNFLVPVGIGILAVIGSLLLIETWKHAWISPYSYSSMLAMGRVKVPSGTDLAVLSLGYFIIMLVAAYVLYRLKR